MGTIALRPPDACLDLLRVWLLFEVFLWGMSSACLDTLAFLSIIDDYKDEAVKF